MSYNNLPGVQVSTIDGGLVARRVPTSKSVLVLGTAAQGPAEEPYLVSDRATAAQTFGFTGNLIRGLEEVALGGADNVILFRIGTTPATLAGVGANTGSVSVPGVTLSFGQVISSVDTSYSIWYGLTGGTPALYVWYGTQLVYANDAYNDEHVDTGDVTVTGTLTGTGLTLGSGSPSLANALTVSAAAAATPQTNKPAPTFTAAVIGTGLTGRQLYVAIAEALELLDIYPVDSLCVPDVEFDNPNVAFYNVVTDPNGVNNPATNPDALDWLAVATDAAGNKVYKWASETVDSNGNTTDANNVPLVSETFTSATQRSAATWQPKGTTITVTGYGEVNFAHLLASFAYKQEKIGQAGTCLVFIGTSGPATFKLVDLRTWAGFLPEYDPTVVDQVGNADIKVLVDGSGLLGNPYLAGCTGARLHVAATDAVTGRTAGLFLSGDYYDSPAEIDKNGNPIDLGAYVHVVADVAIMANGFKNGYASNLANYAAGYTAGMDEKVNLTNKPVKATQLWKPNSVQLDSATQIGVNFLRFKGNNSLPVFTHGQTAATNASDYKNLLRQRIKGLVVDTLRTTADPFIGASSIDGLQIQALQTALNNKLLALQKRGYIANFSFTITTTPAQQRIGHAQIDITFSPADELIQLDASVAVSRS